MLGVTWVTARWPGKAFIQGPGCRLTEGARKGTPRLVGCLSAQPEQGGHGGQLRQASSEDGRYGCFAEKQQAKTMRGEPQAPRRRALRYSLIGQRLAQGGAGRDRVIGSECEHGEMDITRVSSES